MPFSIHIPPWGSLYSFLFTSLGSSPLQSSTWGWCLTSPASRKELCTFVLSWSYGCLSENGSLIWFAMECVLRNHSSTAWQQQQIFFFLRISYCWVIISAPGEMEVSFPGLPRYREQNLALGSPEVYCGKFIFFNIVVNQIFDLTSLPQPWGETKNW